MLGALVILALVAGGLLRILGATHVSDRLLVAGVFLAIAVPLAEAALAIIGAFIAEHWFITGVLALSAIATMVMKALQAGKGAHAERVTLKKRVSGDH